jgi:hypothetical protein
VKESPFISGETLVAQSACHIKHPEMNWWISSINLSCMLTAVQDQRFLKDPHTKNVLIDLIYLQLSVRKWLVTFDLWPVYFYRHFNDFIPQDLFFIRETVSVVEEADLFLSTTVDWVLFDG